MKLKLQITNVTELVPALPVTYMFSQRGGLIGSDAKSDWQIQDLDGTIAAIAARVTVMDEQFVFEVLGGDNVFINGATAPVPLQRPILLSDKDTLKIGALECHVEVGERNQYAGSSVSSMASFAMENGNQHDALVIDGVYEEAPTVTNDEQEVKPMDPLSGFDQQSDRLQTLDPIEALNKGKQNTMENDLERDDASKVSNYDGTRGIDAAIIPPEVSGKAPYAKDRYGFEELNDEQRHEAATLDLDHPVDHVALRPLSRALGISLGEMSSEQAQNMLQDMGGALRAAILGMNRIYKRRDAAGSKFPLTTLHMHAVEDNPLRFSGDETEALHAMFAKRGAVHLSPTAAVQEAMDHFSLHQEATEKAIDRALDAVLAALSPKALEKRFASYAPQETPETGRDKEAWSWGMYKAYFEELRSQRQKGLQMLFWEVFQHEYQGILRQHELFHHGDE